MKAKEHFLQVEDKQLREVLLSNLEKHPNKNGIEDMSIINYDTPSKAVNSFIWDVTEQDSDIWSECYNLDSFQPYYDKYGKSEGTTNVIGAVHESMYKPSTHRLLDAKPPIESTLKSLATPNPLDESELRKKANGLWDELRTISTKLNDDCYGKILDFAKYYHSIQAKDLQEKLKRAYCYLGEKDKEIGLLRDEVMNHLEGKYIVLYDSTMPKFDSFEEAVQRAKVKNDKRLQIFKLVAEVEKVTTINVKEV